MKTHFEYHNNERSRKVLFAYALTWLTYDKFVDNDNIIYKFVWSSQFNFCKLYSKDTVKK